MSKRCFFSVVEKKGETAGKGVWKLGWKRSFGSRIFIVGGERGREGKRGEKERQGKGKKVMWMR